MAQAHSSCLPAAQVGDKQQSGQGQRDYTDCRFLNAQPMPSWCKYCQPQLPHRLFLTLSSQETSCVSRTGSALMVAQKPQHHEQTKPPHSSLRSFFFAPKLCSRNSFFFAYIFLLFSQYPCSLLHLSPHHPTSAAAPPLAQLLSSCFTPCS